jgi:hypothetical protein
MQGGYAQHTGLYLVFQGKPKATTKPSGHARAVGHTDARWAVRVNPWQPKVSNQVTIRGQLKARIASPKKRRAYQLGGSCDDWDGKGSMIRASVLHTEGRRFETSIAHHIQIPSSCLLSFLKIKRSTTSLRYQFPKTVSRTNRILSALKWTI